MAIIQTGDPLAGLNQTLMQLLLMKQQREAADEELKLRKSELKLRQEEFQTKQQMDQIKQQQEQAQSQMASQQLMQNLMPSLLANAGAALGGQVPGQIQQPQMTQAETDFARFAMNPQTPNVQALAVAPASRQQMELERGITQTLKQTTPMLMPDEQAGFQSALTLLRAGAPKEIYEALLPQKVIELNKARMDIASAKNAMEADKAAMPWLIKNGFVAADSPLVEGAAKMVKDEVSKRQGDARQASLEMSKLAMQQQQQLTKEGMEGDALRIAMEGYGQSTPKQIEEQLRAMFPKVAPGTLTNAAVNAAGAARKYYSPQTEYQGKLWLVAPMAETAYSKIEELSKKGVRWTDDSQTALEEFKILGVEPSSVVTTKIRQWAHKNLTGDQQELLLAVLFAFEGTGRPLSGAQITDSEVKRFLYEIAPLETEQQQAIDFKGQVRDAYRQGLRRAASMPEVPAAPSLGDPKKDAEVQEFTQRARRSWLNRLLTPAWADSAEAAWRKR